MPPSFDDTAPLNRDDVVVRLGPFVLEGVLARGGMAEVWAARHQDGTPVAIKVLTGDRARDERFGRALRHEVRAVAGLAHPAIVTVLDAGEVDAEAEERTEGRLLRHSPYLVMERASGGALDSAEPPGSFPALRELLLALLDALAHAHARGVVHRDLKPANVLVCTADDLRPGVKLSDFGLAVAVGRSPELAATAGTPAFMAPEQFRGEWREVGPWTDLYALGCMAWFWTTRRPLFQGDRRQLARAHQASGLPPFQPRMPVPDGFRRWLGALLAKAPSERCQRAADAAWALLQLGLPEGLPTLPDALGTVPTSALVALPTLTEIPSSEIEVTELAATPSAPSGTTPRLLPPPVPDGWDGGVAPAFPPSLVGAGLALFGSRAVPVVGRAAERGVLWAALRRVARSGQPGAVVLRGPAGTGKSRLAQWLCQRADELGSAVWLRAGHQPKGGSGLRGMLATWLATAGLAGDDLRVWLRRRLPSDLSAAAVAAFLSEGGDAGGLVLGSAEERWRLLRRVLQHETRDRAAIVWIDDAQWGADALSFAADLLRVGGVPVLLVLTVRDEALERRPAEAAALREVQAIPKVQAVDLAPLPVHDCSTLLQALLALEPALADSVAARAGGNPLFAVQLLGDWVQRGLLEARRRGYVLRAGAGARLPDDIHSLWRDRLAAALPPEAEPALQVAAVLGVDVDGTEWADVAGRLGVSVPDEGVEALLASGLATGTSERWRFSHALLRESLERRAHETRAWRRMHEACAQMLLGRPDAGARARRGRHLVEAGRFEEAMPELHRAATDLAHAGDSAQALALVEEWDRAAKGLALPAEDPRRGDGEILRLEILYRGQAYDDVFTLAEEVAARAVRHGWTRALARATRIAAACRYHAGALDEAAQRYQEALQLFERLGDADGRMEALCGLGHVARLRGAVDRAAAHYREALASRGASTQPNVVREALLGLGASLYTAGDHGEALQYLEEARELVEASGSAMARVTTWTILGEIAKDRGDLVRALEHYRRAAELDATIGRDGLVPRLNLAAVLVASERFAEGRALLESLLQIASRQRTVVETFVRCALLACDAADRRWEAFDTGLRAVLEVADGKGVVEMDMGRLMHQAGRLARAAGQDARAQLALGAALRQFRALGRDDRVRAVRRDLLGDSA